MATYIEIVIATATYGFFLVVPIPVILFYVK